MIPITLILMSTMVSFTDELGHEAYERHSRDYAS
jgi:hypothetical protein